MASVADRAALEIKPPAPPRAVPKAGSITLRVRYCECDPMGVAHHAAYAPWLEMGRTELLRAAGVTYAEFEKAGVFLVVAKLEIRFRRPVYYDDVLEIRTRVSSTGRVKIEHEYEVGLVESGAKAAQQRAPGEVLTAASTVLVCVQADGSVRPLPDWLSADTAAGSR